MIYFGQTLSGEKRMWNNNILKFYLIYFYFMQTELKSVETTIKPPLKS